MKQKYDDNNNENKRVEDIISLVTKNLKAMIDTKMVIGEAIESNNATIIPISKLSVGFVSGGGEYDKKSEKETNVPFAGGSGAGYTVAPVGFLVVQNGEVKLLKVSPNELTSKIIEVVPEVVDIINKNLKKD